MKILIIKSIILGVFLYIIHIGSWLIWDHFYGKPSAFIGGFGVFIYGLIFALWGYILMSGIYIRWSKGNVKKIRYFKSTIVILIGYLLSRISDIIDDDFFNRFSWQAVFSFLLLIPILVEVELWLKPKIDKRT
jgi:hypothetical protein